VSLLGLGHQHSTGNSPVHRWPATIKLGTALFIIIGTVSLPLTAIAWFAGVGALLGAVIWLSRVSLVFLIKRLLALSPFVLGVALVNAWQPAGRAAWVSVAVKGILCLLTVTLVSNTTPFSHILRVLRVARVPALLITTIALMHRYLFVLADEADRMRRARLSRTLQGGQRGHWRVLATVAGQLFIRASERAERIYDAMRARGWQ
jgi:cobalt/nickel transport system permease protein